MAQQQTARIRRPRSASFTTSRRGSIDPEDPTLDISNIRQPGGFRRNYIQRRAVEDGQPAQDPQITRNFVDVRSPFLRLV